MSAILVVDDHPLLAQGLSYAFRAEGFEVHITAEPDRELVTALALVHRPVLALVDLQFEGAMRGLDLIAPLTVHVPVVVLTGVADPAVLGACLEAGAVGVASKAEPFDRFFERIHRALRGEPLNTVREREEMVSAYEADRRAATHRWSAFDGLSVREREVLELLASGLSADAIATHIFVSVATVRTHIQAILRKLGVSSQLAAVARVREAGWAFDAALSQRV
jgi:two-component system nitrate/nitrite response regulator NarL